MIRRKDRGGRRSARTPGVVLTACAAVLVLVLSACGSGGNTAGKASTTGAGKLVQAMVSVPTTFDPIKAGSPQRPYLTPVFDTLLDTGGSGDYKPSLATDWKFDGKTLQLTLRDDVTFTDGTKFDATAVKENFERGKANPGPNSYFYSALGDITVTDATHLTVTMASPLDSLLDDLTGAPGMMLSPAAFNNPELDRNPVGTGPWKLDMSKSVDGSSYVYVKNDDYWNKKVQKFDTIEIKALTDPTALMSALTTGQVDQAQVSGQQVKAAESAGLTLTRDPNIAWSMMIMDRNGEIVPALADVRVRQAMAYAIDRKALLKAVLFGEGESGGSFFAKGQLGYSEKAESAYEFNLDKAKKLMAEAGYASGFSMTIPTVPVFQSMAEAVAGQLSEIGIKVTLEPLQSGALASAFSSKKYPVVVYYAVFSHPFRLYQTAYSQTGATNPWKVSTPDIDALAAQAATASSDQKEQIYADMMNIVSDQALSIVLSRQNLVIASASDIKGTITTDALLPDPRGLSK